jgi:hypothetical protein
MSTAGARTAWKWPPAPNLSVNVCAGTRSGSSALGKVSANFIEHYRMQHRVELHPEAAAHFERFLSWRAQCLEQEQRIEAMDESAVPDEFAEHVSRYRYGRATAIVDRAGNPEAAAIAAVRSWLQSMHQKRGPDA